MLGGALARWKDVTQRQLGRFQTATRRSHRAICVLDTGFQPRPALRDIPARRSD